ncbi:MAG: HK97 family phage prohead protease [Planctomycetaceae bacterium]|nr:HK97 family phage prohead protease [Planctomycetaceae bacterium]
MQRLHHRLVISWERPLCSKGTWWIFTRGCFDDCFADAHTLPVRINHSPQWTVGRVHALENGDAGLMVTFSFFDSALGRHAEKTVERGELPGMSIRFRHREAQWERIGKARVRRVLRAAIEDISVVAYAVDKATIDARRI